MAVGLASRLVCRKEGSMYGNFALWFEILGYNASLSPRGQNLLTFTRSSHNQHFPS